MLINSRLRCARNVIQNYLPVAFRISNGISVTQRRGKKDDSNISSLFVPVHIKPNPDDINVGAELTGTLNKNDLLMVLNKFYQQKEIKQLLIENGLDRMFLNTLYSLFL